jgi:hypothetical protein
MELNVTYLLKHLTSILFCSLAIALSSFGQNSLKTQNEGQCPKQRTCLFVPKPSSAKSRVNHELEFTVSQVSSVSIIRINHDYADKGNLSNVGF